MGIAGVAREDEILTADNNLTDEDGLGVLRRGVVVFDCQSGRILALVSGKEPMKIVVTCECLQEQAVVGLGLVDPLLNDGRIQVEMVASVSIDLSPKGWPGIHVAWVGSPPAPLLPPSFSIFPGL